MFRRFILTVAVVGITVGFAIGRDVVVDIKKVDGSKVTFVEFKKGATEPGKDETATAITNVVVEKKGKAAAAAKKGAGKKGAKGDPVPNEPIDGGLTHDMFKSAAADKTVRATITIDDDGANKDKITKIVVGGGKGGKKGGG